MVVRRRGLDTRIGRITREHGDIKYVRVSRGGGGILVRRAGPRGVPLRSQRNVHHMRAGHDVVIADLNPIPAGSENPPQYPDCKYP